MTWCFVGSLPHCSWRAPPQWAFAIATQRRVWTAIVRYGLHFVMSVAMAMMAWPWGPQLPTLESAVFFLLAAGWFVIATRSFQNEPLRNEPSTAITP